MRNYIDNNPNRRMSQWWFDPNLTEAAKKLAQVTGDTIDDLVQTYQIPLNTRYTKEQMYLQAIQPTYNEKIFKARAAYICDSYNGHVPEDYDSLLHPDRAALSQFEWFGSMWQTWVSMARWPEQIRDRSIELYSERVQFVEASSVYEKFKRVDIRDKQLERISRGWMRQEAFEYVQAKIASKNVEADEDYNRIRARLIKGYGESYAMAMSALPFSVQVELSQNLYKLFDHIEPVMQYSAQPYVLGGLPIIAGPICNLLKMWWIEFYDCYVHGLPPPFPFSIRDRILNILRARLAELNLPEDEESIRELCARSKNREAIGTIINWAKMPPETFRLHLKADHVNFFSAPIYWPVADLRSRYAHLWEWSRELPYAIDLSWHVRQDLPRIGA